MIIPVHVKVRSVILLGVITVTQAFNSTAWSVPACSGKPQLPLCLVDEGKLVIRLESEADISDISGIGSARDEALLTAGASIAETLLGLKCANGSCNGVDESEKACPQPVVLADNSSTSLSINVSGLIWSTICEGTDRVRVEASYSMQLCQTIPRLGRRCYAD
jgi:hypothetical protein